MGKYCVNCGNKLHTGARFCGKCSAPVVNAPAPSTPANAAAQTSIPPAQPQAQPVYIASQPQTQPTYSAPMAANRVQPARTAKKKKGSSALCVILAIVLAAQTTIVALYGWPGFAAGGKIKPLTVLESDTFTLQEGQTSIETGSGASMGFGCLLEDGEEITVERVKPASVDRDVEIYAYSFKLSSGQPEGAIELIIPYDDAGLSTDEELQSVCGKYLNEQTGKWEDVFYTVDTQANEVHIITDHLSTYSAFKIVDPTKRSAYISDVNVYAVYMTMEQADALLKTYSAQGPTWQEDVVSSYLSATGSLEYFIESNMHTLLSLGGAYNDLVSSRFQKAMTGLGISTACTQFAFDAYNNGLASRTTAVSAMQSTLNIAINFATPSIQLAYLGVGVIDLALTDVRTFALEKRYESTKNMYDKYYKRSDISRTTKDWLKLFKKIYNENKSKPQAALDMMNAEIDRYVHEYWDVAGSDNDYWEDSFDQNADMSKYPWPNKEDRTNISNMHKAALYEYLQVVFKTISRDIYFDGLIAREKELEDMAMLLNSQYAIKITEKVEDGESPKWAGCYARLAPLSHSADEKAWTGKLNDEGGGTIIFTLLAHQKAGFPMTLELYETADDVKEGKVALTVPIEPFKENEQTIVLGNAGLSLDDIIGTYEMTTSFEGASQQHSIYFSKNADKLVAASDIDESFEMAYDPSTGTANVTQKFPHEDDEVTVQTTFEFTLENGGIKITGKAVMSFQGQAVTSVAQYEGYKTD